MTDIRDTAAAFDRIADRIESLFFRLGRAAPGAELETIRDEITALLDSAGLRWSDVAARVAAPSPAKPKPIYMPPPPPPEWNMSAANPAHPDAPVDPNQMATDKELQAYGYRSRGYGYGYENTLIPGVDDPKLPG